MEHFLDRSTCVHRWNRDYPPRLTVDPGDSVEVQMRDSSDGQVTPGMSLEDFKKIDTTRIHALTGPIAVRGAEPGDRLIVEVLDIRHEGWAWTSILPGLGLLPEDFPTHSLQFWELEEEVTHSMPGLTIPLAPFCGILGVQPEAVGEFRTRPPGRHGGNLDVRQLVKGCRLHLPVLVPEAGLCAGDAHAAQGDGEVSINGMEAPMTVRLRIELSKGQAPAGPCLECPTPPDPERVTSGPSILFIESDPDPREASKRVVRRAIDYLCARVGLTPEQAYITCSVTLRLALSQVVNTPMTTVSGTLPEALFDEPSTILLP